MQIKLKGRIFYHLVVVAKNGEPVLTSETYYSKGNAVRAGKRASKVLNIPFVNS